MQELVAFFQPLHCASEIWEFLAVHRVFLHPGFLWDFQLEGYKNHVFGSRNGKVSTLSGLCHELAHAVEFGVNQFESRASPHGWEFSMPYMRFMGHKIYRPKSPQASYREGRVVAIEQRMCEILTGQVLGAEYCANRAFSMVENLPDFHLIESQAQAFKFKVMDEYLAFDWCQTIHSLNAWFEKTYQYRHRRIHLPSSGFELGEVTV